MLYADVEYQGEVHKRAHELVDDAFTDFVRHHREQPVEIREEPASVDFRTGRLAELLKMYLMMTVKDIGEWHDTLEFHELGTRNSEMLKRMLDWFSEHAEIREAAEAAGVFVVDRATDAATRMETEMCGALRSFIRKCRPVVVKRGYHRFLGVNMPDSGVAFGTDGNGDRDILAWSPGERLN